MQKLAQKATNYRQRLEISFGFDKYSTSFSHDIKPFKVNFLKKVETCEVEARAKPNRPDLLYVIRQDHHASRISHV